MSDVMYTRYVQCSECHTSIYLYKPVQIGSKKHMEGFVCSDECQRRKENRAAHALRLEKEQVNEV